MVVVNVEEVDEFIKRDDVIFLSTIINNNKEYFGCCLCCLAMFILVSDFDTLPCYVNVYRKWGFQLKQTLNLIKGRFYFMFGQHFTPCQRFVGLCSLSSELGSYRIGCGLAKCSHVFVICFSLPLFASSA